MKCFLEVKLRIDCGLASFLHRVLFWDAPAKSVGHCCIGPYNFSVTFGRIVTKWISPEIRDTQLWIVVATNKQLVRKYFLQRSFQKHLANTGGVLEAYIMLDMILPNDKLLILFAELGTQLYLILLLHEQLG